MVHKGMSSSYRSVDCIGLWLLGLALYPPSASDFMVLCIGL